MPAMARMKWLFLGIAVAVGIVMLVRRLRERENNQEYQEVE